MLLAVLTAVHPLSALSQLQELDAATASGAATSARFFAGATGDNGASYGNSFSSNDRIGLHATILVASEHVGRTGKLYVVMEYGGIFLIQVESGSLIPWDGSAATLEPRMELDTLMATESLSVLDALELAPLGVAGTQLDLYLGYSVDSAPDELHYSATPFELLIAEYDPLMTATDDFQVLDTVTVDEGRERELPTLVYLPEHTDPAPVILFSHGLGGTRYAATYLFEHFARRGYVVVSMQHPGSDSSLYEGLPPSQILAAFNAAASFENLVLRIGDVSSVIDQLEAWNSDSGHELNQRMDLDHIGMSGHSFGARTTQTTSGEHVLGLPYPTLEPRIDAAIPYSTSVASPALAGTLLGEVDLPWLVMTGTLDEAVVGNASIEDRLAVYPALPAGDKYELVLFEGTHSAFTDGYNPDDAFYNPAHHDTVTALSTAFWDTFLRGNPSARAWLEGPGADSMLSEGDSWRFK